MKIVQVLGILLTNIQTRTAARIILFYLKNSLLLTFYLVNKDNKDFENKQFINQKEDFEDLRSWL